MKIKSNVCFDDVLLTPQYSEVQSRRDIDTSTQLPNSKYIPTTPIISSPMDTITESAMAIKMLKLGGLGIIHRYNTIEEQRSLVSEVSEALLNESHDSITGIAAAVGVSGDYVERAQALYSAGARILCVDIAHGHHTLMKSALSKLRSLFGSRVHLMAGNVATLQGFNDLSDWGADSIRVGIGGGSICSTRVQTGHGMPTLQSILECSMSDRDAIMIADGGLRTSGDIVKALAAGADMVMLGSLFSGTSETPGEVLCDAASDYSYVATTSSDGLVGYSLSDPAPEKLYKRYRGMASKEAQVEWRGYQSSDEGVATTVPYKGPVDAVVSSLVKGIRSGLSYSGAFSISELQSKAVFTKQTFSGVSESSTHILNLKH